jgi:phosphoenolpyruvate-protein kinase (PTS system EI component)
VPQSGTGTVSAAAAITINSILPEVDFARTGPGDLSQFTLAKSRMNISPMELSGSSIHPAVLALIGNVAKECKKVNKPVSMVLDLEPRIKLLQMLLSVGIRTFCVSPSNIQITFERLNEAARL